MKNTQIIVAIALKQEYTSFGLLGPAFEEENLSWATFEPGIQFFPEAHLSCKFFTEVHLSGKSPRPHIHCAIANFKCRKHVFYNVW